MAESFKTKQAEILKEIKNSYKKRRLIPFVGAGFSKNIEGYPTWGGFIKILCDDLKKDGVDIDPVQERRFKNNPLEATEYYIRSKGKKEEQNPSSIYSGTAFERGKRVLLKNLNDLFCNHVYKENKWNLHNTLMSKKKFKVVYTTNWDNTLEQANDKKLTPIFKVDQFKSIIGSSSIPRVIKFHGHFEYNDGAVSLIACETDYMKRISEENPFDIKFKNDLLHNDFLFIGYSFSDPNVKLVLYEIKEILTDVHATHKPNIYWISANYIDKERVNLVSQMFDDIIKPYFLLTEKQETKLKNYENKIKKQCCSCSFYWECDNTKCRKYKNRENLIKKLEPQEKQYIKLQLKKFLDKF